MNLIGLPVDDDEAVGTAIQQIDVALDEVIADQGGNPQLSPELTRRRFGGDRRRKCVSGESFDYVLAVGHLSCGLAAAAAVRPAPSASPMTWSTPCTARPTAVP